MKCKICGAEAQLINGTPLCDEHAGEWDVELYIQENTKFIKKLQFSKPRRRKKVHFSENLLKQFIYNFFIVVALLGGFMCSLLLLLAADPLSICKEYGGEFLWIDRVVVKGDLVLHPFTGMAFQETDARCFFTCKYEGKKFVWDFGEWKEVIEGVKQN